jgi:hypothetical protein
LGKGEQTANGELRAIAETFAQLGSGLKGLSPAESLGALAQSAVDRVPGARHASITNYVHDSFRHGRRDRRRGSSR